MSHDHEGSIKILLGRDPRSHGIVLADAFSRGAESVKGIQVLYTGLATTPSMASFCRSNLCNGAVMVTASHLPKDRNGFKFFSGVDSFEPQQQISELIELAQQRASYWYDQATIPPTSGPDAVFCSGGWVDHMGHYKQALKQALIKEVTGQESDDENQDSHQDILKGLKIVLNSGNGSGGFFASVLHELGADVSGSIHIQPNGHFPNGVPNPENQSMIRDTIQACQTVHADLGILLDTDADRCGLVVPAASTTSSSENEVANPPQYQAIHRNKLIALMGVIFAHDSPGCAIVTCSVTSQGLAKFLTHDLGLLHVRYLKGYANVIQKAKALTESGQADAQVAIETSGHCAMKENDYLDDGTYTAVKVIGLLAREKAKDPSFSLPSLIQGMKEMDEIVEIRMAPLDGTLESTSRIFDQAAKDIEAGCRTMSGWSLDTENLEGIRVTVGDDGSFFMLRKSLHDPVLSLQVEADSKEDAKRNIVDPILSIFEASSQESDNIRDRLEFRALQGYAQHPGV
jgi:phosphomannomutase